MAQNVAAMVGTPANMAAIETEFQANWAGLNVMMAARRPNCFVRTNLAAGQTLRLLVRSANGDGSGNAVWTQSAAGSFTSPARVTTDGSDWVEARFVVGTENSGFVVLASAACTVQVSTTDAV